MSRGDLEMGKGVPDDATTRVAPGILPGRHRPAPARDDDGSLLVPGLNLKKTLRSNSKTWKPKLAARADGKKMSRGHVPNPPKQSVFATLSSEFKSEWSRLRRSDVEADDGVLKIEFLHRYNILWARSRLLGWFHKPQDVDLVDDEVAGEIYQDLCEYCKSASQLDQYPAKKAARARAVNTACREIGKELFDEITKTSSGTTQELLQKDDKVFGNRLLAALGGGLALIAPMLIMVLAPHSKATALTTTCCFVLAVAIALAVFMKDSQPKDVVACIAAYTAVLLVFVGVGGGT